MERAWNGLLCEEEAFLKAEYLLFFAAFLILLSPTSGGGRGRGWKLEREWGRGGGGSPSSQTTVRVHSSLTRDSFVHREYCVRDYVKYLAKRAGITEQSTGK